MMKQLNRNPNMFSEMEQVQADKDSDSEEEEITNLEVWLIDFWNNIPKMLICWHFYWSYIKELEFEKETYGIFRKPTTPLL